MCTFFKVTEETEEKVENVLQDLFWKLVELRVRDCLSLSFIIITNRYCEPSFASWLNFKGKLVLKNILYSILRLIFNYMQIVPPEEKKAPMRFFNTPPDVWSYVALESIISRKSKSLRL